MTLGGGHVQRCPVYLGAGVLADAGSQQDLGGGAVPELRRQVKRRRSELQQIKTLRYIHQRTRKLKRERAPVSVYYPVCSEGGAVCHQFPHFFILTVTSGFQQPLPQIHQRHEEPETHGN